MALATCKRGIRTACEYKVSSEMNGIADSEDGKTLNEILFIFGGDRPSPLVFMETLVVTMALFAPAAAAEERGIVVRELMTDIAEKKKSEAQLHGVTYKLTVTDGLGLWLTVKR